MVRIKNFQRDAISIMSENDATATWQAEPVNYFPYEGGKLHYYIDPLLELPFFIHASGETIRGTNISDTSSSWNIPTAPGGLLSFSCSSGATRIFILHKNGKIVLWTRKCLGNDNFCKYAQEKAWNVSRLSVGIFPDTLGNYVALSNSDHSIDIWNVASGLRTHNMVDHTSVITCVAFDSFGHKLVSGDISGVVIVWDLQTNLKTTLCNHTASVCNLTFCWENNYLISCGRDKILNVWKGKEMILIQSIPVLENIETVCEAPCSLFQAHKPHATNFGSTYIITSGSSGKIRVWGMEKQLIEISSNRIQCSSFASPCLGDSEGIQSMVVDDRSRSFVCGTTLNRVLVFDTNTLSISKEVFTFNDEVTDLKSFCNSNTRFIAFAGSSESIHVANLSTLHKLTLSTKSQAVISLDVSTDASRIVSCTTNGEILLHDTASCKLLACCMGHKRSGAVVRWLKRKKHIGICSFLSAGSDGDIKIWRIEAKDENVHVTTLMSTKGHNKTVNDLDFLDKVNLIASASQDRTIKLWKLEESDKTRVHMSTVATLRGHKRGVWSVRFSGLNSYLASSSGDWTVRLWCCKENVCLCVLEGHNSPVLRVEFFNQGNMLASTGANGDLRVWGVHAGKCIFSGTCATKKSWGLAVWQRTESPTSHSILVAGSKIVIWKDLTRLQQELRLKRVQVRNSDMNRLRFLMKRRNFEDALCLSLKYNAKMAALNIFNKIVEEEERDCFSNEAMTSIFELAGIKNIEKENLKVLLGFAVEWNNRRHTYFIAQLCFRLLMRTNLFGGYDDVENENNMFCNSSYSHLQRINSYIKHANILDLILL